MYRLYISFVVLVVFIAPLRAEQQENQQPAAEHAAVLAELTKARSAARSYELNDAGEIIAISLSGHLAPNEIMAVQKLKTLKTLTLGGNLPFSRLNPPTQSQRDGEKRRQELYPRALLHLGALVSVTNLQLRDVPSASEMQVVLGWKQLESITGEIPPQHYRGIAKLTKLRHLTLRGKYDQSLSGQFLAPLMELETLSLPPGFGDDTLVFLANKPRLTNIKGDGISGESLVEFYMKNRGLSLPHAMRAAGYWVDADEFGKVTKLHFAYTTTFDRLYSKNILQRLTNLRDLTFTHIDGRDDQVLHAIRCAPLESLTLTNVSLRPDAITEISKVSSLKRLSVAFSAKEIELPAISGLPALEYLSLGGINDNRTHVTKIHDLPKLVELRIHGSDIERPLVEQLRQLPRLKHLVLSGGTVSHTAIEGIAAMGQLESIDLSRTNIGDEQLALLGKLTRLQSLNTRRSNVSVNARARFLREHFAMDPLQILEDAGARCRGELDRITFVSFGKRFGSELIRSAAELPELRKLKFVMTQLDKDALASLAMLSTVDEVDFVYCKSLDNAMIARLAEMPALRKLKIASSGLTDDSKATLLQLTNLESIEISGKSISPDVIAEVRAKIEGTDIEEFRSSSSPIQ